MANWLGCMCMRLDKQTSTAKETMYRCCLWSIMCIDKTKKRRQTNPITVHLKWLSHISWLSIGFFLSWAQRYTWLVVASSPIVDFIHCSPFKPFTVVTPAMHNNHQTQSLNWTLIYAWFFASCYSLCGWLECRLFLSNSHSFHFDLFGNQFSLYMIHRHPNA